MIACREPQLHVVFFEDLAFLYNPFSLEEQMGDDPPVTDPTSVITGWGAPEKMDEVGMYIEKHIPRGGRVCHTFALFKARVRCTRLPLCNALN